MAVIELLLTIFGVCLSGCALAADAGGGNGGKEGAKRVGNWPSAVGEDAFRTGQLLVHDAGTGRRRR